MFIKLLCVAMAVALMAGNVYAADMKLMEMRDRVYDESTQMKPLLANSQDVVLLGSMWDACLMAMMQLDAYFYMVGIFNEVNEEAAKAQTIDYLIKWLTQMKAANDVNIGNLSTVGMPVQAKTQVHIDRLKNLFFDINKVLDVEIRDLNFLKSRVPKKK